MITAIRYLDNLPKDETRYLNPMPHECLHNKDEEIHFFVTVGYDEPVREVTYCLCKEKFYHGLHLDV